ncbi:hypothetical protein [Rhodococcus oryzae]|uniref:hypothetical protein n=1 Tax=Rhodococcus oryzae TaxID=2571143 RepID=UPI00378CDA05
MSTLSEQERKLLDLLTRSVHRTFADARAAGVPAEVFDDVESIARSMSAALPTSSVYDQLVGPFYDTTSLTQWWGVSRQAIAKAADVGTVIACRLDGGGWVYPTWQFTDLGTVYPHLITLWATLRGAADPWTCAVWLRSPQSELGDRSAADWIAGGYPLGTALELARNDVHRWAGKEVENLTIALPPQQQNEQPEKKQSTKAVTVYISHEVYTQARLAFIATRTVEADRSWSHFVEKAVEGEIRRRRELHTGGEDFEGVDAPLSPGRPLSDQ